MPRRRLTNTDVKRIKELWLAGVSSVKIAKEFGVDKSTILRVVSKLGLPKHELKRPKYDYNIVRELWEKGLKATEIARMLGIPNHIYVYHLARKLGLRRRRGRSINEKCDEISEKLMKLKVLVSTDIRNMRYRYLLNSCVKLKVLKKVYLINSKICRTVFNNSICGKTIYYVSDDDLIEFLKSNLMINKDSPIPIKKAATNYLKTVLPPQISSAINKLYVWCV